MPALTGYGALIAQEDCNQYISAAEEKYYSGKFNEAISHFVEVLRINPDHGEAHYKLGHALASQGRLKEAVSHFSETLRIKPDHAGARRSLERGLSLMGRSTGDSNTALRP